MAKFLDENGLLYFWSKIKAKFVAQEAGKGLSANDLNNTLKSNYDTAFTHAGSTHAPSNAEQNVQSDWNISDSANDAFIKNKPTIPAAITVDAALSDSSTNTVQNKIIKAALDAKIESNTKGQPNGIASLDASGLIPAAQLPSFVDDVIELLDLATTAPASCVAGNKYFNTSSNLVFTATGTNVWGGTGTAPSTGVIYVDVSENMSYRWGGSVMVLISSAAMTAITNAEIDGIVAT